jgi:uncharacterized membrane protein (DUF485 family)
VKLPVRLAFYALCIALGMLVAFLFSFIAVPVFLASKTLDWAFREEAEEERGWV